MEHLSIRFYIRDTIATYISSATTAPVLSSEWYETLARDSKNGDEGRGVRGEVKESTGNKSEGEDAPIEEK
jgi:hypothetical protein